MAPCTIGQTTSSRSDWRASFDPPNRLSAAEEAGGPPRPAGPAAEAPRAGVEVGLWSAGSENVSAEMTTFVLRESRGRASERMGHDSEETRCEVLSPREVSGRRRSSLRAS